MKQKEFTIFLEDTDEMNPGEAIKCWLIEITPAGVYARTGSNFVFWPIHRINHIVSKE